MKRTKGESGPSTLLFFEGFKNPSGAGVLFRWVALQKKKRRTS